MEEFRLGRGGERDSLRSVSIATAESLDAGLTVPAKAVRTLHDGRGRPWYLSSASRRNGSRRRTGTYRLIINLLPGGARWPAMTSSKDVAARKALPRVLEGLKEAHHARRLFIEAATKGIFWLNGAR
ncbi:MULTISPECIES: DUF982 domain-containing protein [unclassified Mesorhizobium]|uniref:DUF982 domain-containing protein n=1 Tax=unclassified Mesorhizobium TaxID=325217 RepID=UPI001CCA97B4|nr:MULTISPECIES: DUF982 domain-containing protein [unclassified Mesorhizobium]MCA0008803.1 DUF982 domain-containing protein [Mesorhizobium sp. B264B1B]MCA0021902.1 DUF982 domain-containing protein [Mesorhizobium sp. B264B1A]